MSDPTKTTKEEPGYAYTQCIDGEIYLFVRGVGATEPVRVKLTAENADSLRCDLADAEAESNAR